MQLLLHSLVLYAADTSHTGAVHSQVSTGRAMNYCEAPLVYNTQLTDDTCPGCPYRFFFNTVNFFSLKKTSFFLSIFFLVLFRRFIMVNYAVVLFF